MRVLLAVDDLRVGQRIFSTLRRVKYDVDWIRDAGETAHALATETYSVVVIDIGAAQCAGVELIRESRASGCLAPIVAIASHDALHMRLEAFDAGIDDYLCLPFETSELVARIVAVVRRMAGYAQSTLVYGSVSLDLRTRQLSYNGHSEPLPPREFSLMQTLFRKPISVLSRDALQRQLYGEDYPPDSKAVDVLILSLRKKFGASMIQNIRGLGWVLGFEEDAAKSHHLH